MSGHLYRAAHKRQRQDQVKSLLSGNQHTLIQMNSAEFVDYIISVKMKSGMSRAEAVDWIDKLLEEHNSASQGWKRNRDNLKLGSGFIPLVVDMVALGALAIEMERQGNVFAKHKITMNNGKAFITFSGYPGLRKHLTGTRYLANNPKLVKMGIGKLGALNAIKGGGILTVLISASYHSVEQLVDESKTWHHFFAGFAIDIALALASAVAAGLALTALGAAVTVTVGSMLIVVITGTIIAVLFSFIVDMSPWVDALADELINLEKSIKNNKDIRKINNWYQKDPIGLFYRMAGIRRSS